MNVRPLLVLALLLAAVPSASPSFAQEERALVADPGGHVQIPVDVYNRLVEQARDPARLPRVAPARFVLGSARVTVDAVAEAPSGRVGVELAIDVLEDEWVLVPVLPAATAVSTATVGGNEVQLIPTPDGLAWITRKAGSYRMSLAYRVDAVASEFGKSLPVPLPQAGSINLVATLPGTGLDVSVIPAAGLRVQPQGDRTVVNATLPTTSGVQIAWRTPSRAGHATSRAAYTGSLTGDAVVWTGQLDVELFSNESVTLPLLPRAVTLNDVQVDGKEAPILVEGNRFATLLRGQGLHKVVIGFQVPVVRADGPPRVDLAIPSVPVSRFDLTLPGKKEVSVKPEANVASRTRGDSTVATVFAPMTEAISFSWAEAVPEEVRAEVRANASIYHAVYAEEGVLNVRALVLYEVTRGETNQLRLEVPPDVQVNRITAASGAVADWRISQAPAGQPRQVSIFLDRMVRDELLFEVHYDRSLGTAGAEQVALPLLRAPEAHRQRGMVALLQSKDLSLEPVAEGEATRVGENQLPPFVREALDMTVAHTYKYVETLPQMTVAAALPEREQGRFDAQVDTLISLGEVTLAGSASVEIHLKSGTLMDLELDVPAGVNLLNLTGPSVRDYQVEADGDRQRVTVQFTQEMEGQFRLELAYERILGDSDAQVAVPTVGVEGAEVEQGRIAVEALSAVEVKPAATEQLSSVDIAELPRQLVLRTTNPILLAYKYVQTEPPPRLALEVTRHRLLDVQEAAIDRADYRTLFTRDGLAVTIARFQVRNSRKQFLRVRLPEGADVWSASVDGRPEQPALEGGEAESSGPRAVLLKIVNSTAGFPVELIYATPGGKIRGLGTVRAMLPRPDILVTESSWDVFLPAAMAYREPKSNMEITTAGRAMSPGELEAQMERLSDGEAQAMAPLRIVVPTAGVSYSFTKLYANQGEEEAWFQIGYASAAGAAGGRLLSLLGALLMWSGVALRLWPREQLPERAELVPLVLGGLLVIVTVGFYDVSPRPLLVLSLLVLVGGAVFMARDRLRGLLATRLGTSG